MNAITKIANPELPIAVIGAGPVGLAAAAHLLARGLAVKVYESGDTAAANIREWGHVKLFSPWVYNIDKQAKVLLEKAGWQEPLPLAYPTGQQLYDLYIKPLSETAELSAVIETSAKVTGVARAGFDKMKTAGRDSAPFVLTIQKTDGSEREDLARAVIDASGTFIATQPDRHAWHAGARREGKPPLHCLWHPRCPGQGCGHLCQQARAGARCRSLGRQCAS